MIDQVSIAPIKKGKPELTINAKIEQRPVERRDANPLYNITQTTLVNPTMRDKRLLLSSIPQSAIGGLDPEEELSKVLLVDDCSFNTFAVKRLLE